MVEALELWQGKIPLPHAGSAARTEPNGGSSGAEKSELSKVDMDTHSSKKFIASSVRRFDIFRRSMLVCHHSFSPSICNLVQSTTTGKQINVATKKQGFVIFQHRSTE